MIRWVFGKVLPLKEASRRSNCEQKQKQELNHLKEVNKVLQAMEPLSPHNPVSGIVRVTDLHIFRNQIQARMVILNF